MTKYVDIGFRDWFKSILTAAGYPVEVYAAHIPANAETPVGCFYIIASPEQDMPLVSGTTGKISARIVQLSFFGPNKETVCDYVLKIFDTTKVFKGTIGAATSEPLEILAGINQGWQVMFDTEREEWHCIGDIYLMYRED